MTNKSKPTSKRNVQTPNRPAPRGSGFGQTPDAKHFQEEDAFMMPNMFGGMSQRQVARPALLIVQGMSTMDNAQAHVGQIYETVSGQFYDQVELAIVAAPSESDTPRALRARKFDRMGAPVFDPNAELLCASPNGVMPYGGYAGRELNKELGPEFVSEVVPDDCRACIFAAANLCTVFYRYYAFMLLPDGRKLPVVLRFKNTGLEGARRLNLMLIQNQEQNIYTTFIMSTQVVPTKNGSTVYGPTFTPNAVVTDRKLLMDVVQANAAYQREQERLLQNTPALAAQIKEDLS